MCKRKEVGGEGTNVKEGQEGNKLFRNFTLWDVETNGSMCLWCPYTRRLKYLRLCLSYNSIIWKCTATHWTTHTHACEI